MNIEQKQALNNRIAEWCNCKLIPTPNFCDSMDELIKWACPKLDELNCTINANNESATWSFGIAQGADDYVYESNESPSMALSLAIEKLINSKEK